MNRVWAPFVKQLSIVYDSREVPLTCEGDGWWTTGEGAPRSGQDYHFRLDGGEPIPDPRSPWQPDGVNGPSRHVDHSLFAWTDRNWQSKPLSAGILYELHIGTFTPEGTFDAAIDKLDHLVSLGVSHIEVMPVAEFLGDYGWGYDGVFLFAPHHAYGGPDGFKRLIDACHARGLGVILDVVYNHLGPCGNRLAQFGPYFTDRYHTAWGWALNFDGPDSDEVRRLFLDNATMWLRDYHIDGLRLDAVHSIVDSSAIPFLEQLSSEVDALKAGLGRHLFLIAESDLNDPRVINPREMGGYGIDAQWSDDIHHSIHAVVSREQEGYYRDFGSIEHLAIAMRQPYVYAGRHSEYRRRRHGRAPHGHSGSRFVAFIQNHDQLGNRAKGERLGHLVNDNRLKIAAALLFSTPYVPLLFQGEEWDASAPFQYFVDFHEEPELAKAVAEGRRREFDSFKWKVDEVPDPTSRQTFLRSKLDWSELSQPEHARMLAWYKQVIELRGRISALTDGRLDLVHSSYDERHEWLRVERGPVTIACNLADREVSIPLRRDQETHLLLASQPGWKIIEDGNHRSLLLPAESIVILGPAFCS